MAEKKEMRIENIKRASEILKDGKIDELIKLSHGAENEVKSFRSKLELKLKELEIAIKEREEAEKAAAVKEEQPAPVQPAIKAEETSKPVEEPKEKIEEKKVEPEKVEKPTQSEVKVEEVKPAENKVEEKKAEEEKTPARNEYVLPERPSFIVRREGPIQKPEKSQGGYERRPRDGARPNYSGDRPQREYRPKDGAQGAPRAAKPDFNRQGGAKKPSVATYVAPPVVAPSNNRNFNKKKQGGEKQYEDKHALNKRALIRNQVDVDDFDENKTGYRKFRPVKKAKETTESQVIKIEKAVINTEIIPLKVLSEKIGITAAEITKRLFKEGIMKTINDSIDFDTAAFIADDLGIELELKLDKTAEDVLSEGFEGQEDSLENLKKRPPVVTVMGHVDHGKTSLLDRIRKTNVTAGEAGGITQHIGAYQVTVSGEVITFLDTPGHAAFTAMRARGAQATDIAILVVAADDGIMPQTIEAINHAKAADVPILVAINKIDKPEANVERIKTQLTEHGLLPEEWGGDTILCPVSAKTGEGFDTLLENVNLLAEIKDLKANPDRKAKGVVIEAKLDQSKGPIATILVQNGTLKVSDSVIVGTVTGKIRAMVDDKGRRVTSAGPSMPVSIMGLDEVPNAGDILYAVENEKLTKLVAEERVRKEKENQLKASQKVTLDDVFNKIAEGEMKWLNIIVKADVQGSVEAVKQSMEKLSNAEVKVNVIHAAAGAIKESDIMLAESSNAIIIGFNVRPDSNAKQIAERSGVDIKLYRVIYEAIEDVEKALKGMLAPKFTEVYLGKAEVREVFKISGVGQVAGCYVTEGKIMRNSKLRIYRDDVMICEGNVLQLKRFKDDVKEVAQGFECGISIEKFNDIKVGDFIESYQVEENKE
ncbi:MAG: translation initiation factor IF-2 [Clostridiales bacterium]|nr:translation initiation factor IF-2 [Clostridiales bacterium]